MAEQVPNASPRTPAAMQPASSCAPTPDEAELMRLSQEWMDVALHEKDERRLRRLMAPEYTLQIWDGSRAAQDLDTWMHTLLHRLTVDELEYTSQSARVFGDTGVVYSTFWWKGAMDGHPFTDSGFMTDVWSRRDGSWQVVARRSAGQQIVRQLRAAT